MWGFLLISSLCCIYNNSTNKGGNPSKIKKLRVIGKNYILGMA